MTKEMQENVCSVFVANANKQLDLTTVFNKTAAALAANKTFGELYAEAIGKTADAPERAAFREKFMRHMPHVVYNGTDKVVAVDWVEMSDKDTNLKPIRQYKLAGEDVVKREGDTCVEYVLHEQETKKKESVTLASGFVIEVPSRDAKGNYLTETKNVQLVPRKKSVWGYTDTVKQAIIDTLNELF